MDEEVENTLLDQSEIINAWYASCRPQYIDLVGDYAGRELFLLEGDALLRECFGDERIDFQDGFQLLHAIYVVERFLDNLLKRHCRFHIAFFSLHRHLCIPAGVSQNRRSRYLLARSATIQHLQRHLPERHGIQVNVFPSIESDAFYRYLTGSPVHFVMAHDGAVPATGGIEAKSIYIRRDKVALRQTILCFTSQRLNIALINRVEFRDSKVFTMVLESGHAVHRAGKLDLKNLLEGYVFLNTRLRTDSLSNAVLDVSQPTHLEKLLSQEVKANMQGDWRLATLIISLMLSRDTKLSSPLFSSTSPTSSTSFSSLLGSAFVLHTVLIKYIPLSQRRLPLFTFDRDLEDSVADFLTDFAETAIAILASRKWVESRRSCDTQCDLIDLVDGRLFRTVLHAILKGSMVNKLPSAIKDDWAMLSEAVLDMSGCHLSLETRKKDFHTYEQESDVSNVLGLAVMPFSNLVFDQHLVSIHIHTEPGGRPFNGSKVYRETTHWHNRKPLVLKQTPKVATSKWRNPSRTNQFYMREMTVYAASLTGARGKVLEPETVTLGLKNPKSPSEAALKSAKSGSGGSIGSKEERLRQQGKSAAKPQGPSNAKERNKKAPGLSKAQLIIAENKERTSRSESDMAFSSWAMVMKEFDQIHSDEDRYMRVKVYLDSLDTTKSVHIEADVNLYLIQTLLAWWAQHCTGQNKPGGYHVVALIWTHVRALCAARAITKDIAKHVRKICSILAITDARKISTTDLLDRKLSFTFKYPPYPDDLQIALSQVEFQLFHVGPYMDRQLEAQPDPRVSSFTPDGWQREVLDEIDARNSVFVVAPTSAGKTFISFYAMEQILRADNDSVLVYVAPTKALVNQIAAEVQGRFSKKYPQAGKSVWAIHTREYRVNNATGCQILITVPHILQIMLLAPTNAKSWAPRVKWIIFDEIHSISQAQDGVVWEQLLLLAPCPIIALSATVGNPTEFCDWLTETQKALGQKLTMIQHFTRYSDLRKFLYQPPRRFNFRGLGKPQNKGLSLDGLEGLTYFHPVASLFDSSRGMPDDLALEPRDCLLLWKAMSKLQTEESPVPSHLNPAKALPTCIRKADIFKWEKELKQLLLQWMAAGRVSPFEKLVEELSPKSSFLEKQGLAVANAEYLTSSSDNASLMEIGCVDASDLCDTTLPLLCQLHTRGALPAILFNYDRSDCEVVAKSLLAKLTAAENYYKGGKEWQQKLKDWERWKELKEKARKNLAKSKSSHDSEMTSKADQIIEEASLEVSSFDLFNPSEPLDDFSFADKRHCQKSEFDEFVQQLRRKYVREDLITLLQRGIGVHHAGMNRKYRQCVEMLFRKRYLRVVIATGTLSLGINMPCATVVFSGDSVFLTALNFRQAAGRAGRRGFDLLGNVVFQGISMERACRLLSSRLPDLTGHFPITTTLVLRLFTLLSDSCNSDYAVRAINSLLSQPRLYLGGESFKEQVLHHLRFSIEYLRRQDLLGPSGEPINFTSCISHLYFTENSSFAFHALLKDGYFTRLCQAIDTNTSAVLQTIMLVLSHLFGRRVTREVDDKTTAEKIRRSPSKVFLPPMPEEAANTLRRHNAETLSIFATYVKTFSEQQIHIEERVLPLTGVSVGPADNATIGDNESLCTITKYDPLAPSLAFLQSLPVPRARSAFVALSGHGDDFKTIEDLCTSARSGIFLESAVIPHLKLYPDEFRTPLNAYLLDFFMHGSVKPLEEANGIRRSDVWFVLNDFSMVLATIVTSLAGYLGLSQYDINEEVMEVMGTGDAAEHDADEELANEIVTLTTTDLFEPDPTPISFRHNGKKKKVVDNWDDEEDEIDAREMLAEENKLEKANTYYWEHDDREYNDLKNVHRAFCMVKAEFDAKFKAIWA